MAKKQNPRFDEQAKDHVNNIQRRLENLLPKKADIPASMSIQQTEELQARVRELEKELEYERGIADKKTPILIHKTDARSSSSPKQPDPLPLIPASKGKPAVLVATLFSLGHFLSCVYYIYLGWTSEPTKYYGVTAISFALGLLFGMTAVLSWNKRASLACILLLGGMAVAYPPLTILVMGFGLLPGLLLTSASLTIPLQVLPRRPAWVFTSIGIISALATVSIEMSGVMAQPSLPRIFIPFLAAPVVGFLGYFILRQFRQYPLRARLISTFLLLTIVPLTILGWQTYSITHGLLEEQIKAEILRSAISSGAEYQEFVDSQLETLRYQARSREFIEYLSLPQSQRGPEKETVVYEKLKEFAKNRPSYIKSYALLDANGIDVLDTKKSRIGTSFAEHDFFHTLKTDRRPGISGLDISIDGEQNIYFATPVNSKLGELLGFYLVAYNPAIFQSIMEQMVRSDRLAPASTEFTYLVDGTNYFVLAHSTRVDQLYKTYLETDDARLAKLQGQTGIDPEKFSRLVNPQPEIVARLINMDSTTDFQAPSLTGDLAQSAAVRISGLNWIVVVSRPTSIISGLIQSQTGANVVTSGIITVFVALFALLASRFFTAPIIQLTHIAESISTGDLTHKASIQRKDELGILARTFNIMTDQLQALVSGLEQRVEDRTHDLELASEIGHTIAEKVEDLSAMLTEATEMIRSRFNLSYTQVYLLDRSGQKIVLRAGTGEVGKLLLQRWHSLAVDSFSLNGRAVFERRPLIVADTEKSDVFLPNPMLPNTRSEMAIPLLVGDKVLGVLDMQSDIPNELNEENLVAFQVLAGQLAVAIQNATLLAESEAARRQIEANARSITESGWQDFLNAIERGESLGYAFNQTEVRPINHANEWEPINELNIPISVTGAKIGTLQVAKGENIAWTGDESHLAQEVAGLLARHLDNLRLLAQAEGYRREAEQAVRRLTREGWDSFLGNRTAAYLYDLNQVQPITEDREHASENPVTKSLLVRDETIGELAVDVASLSEEETEILAAIAQQLSGHLENLRLLELNERRASELASAAAVSTTTSTLLDPDKLLQTVADLAKERFGLYHAHIYLADEAWNTLLLAAGAGEVGRQMVSEGWNIAINHEQSIVARAGRNREPVIANDIVRDTNSAFLSNRLLPNTRSEMAVPMIVGEKLLGVFDLQADTADYFSPEDASIFTTLAAQIAVALQNARLYAEQAATLTQLRELDKLKSSFLANMSHELRTPLNSILGFTDVMLEGLDGPLTEFMDNDLRLIQKNGRHLLHLINDVLDMAKIESGRMNLNPERFKVHDVLDEVRNITSTLASEKNLSLFITEDSDQELEIYADSSRLRQVLINLVNNAIKFTERGKISISARSIEDAKVLIKVTDTGIGIPQDKLEAIFDEFTQVDTSTTRKVGGTGLGLPISRKLVEMHGGRLWAESNGVSGEGSVFFVELPVEARIIEIPEKQAS